VQQLDPARSLQAAESTSFVTMKLKMIVKLQSSAESIESMMMFLKTSCFPTAIWKDAPTLLKILTLSTHTLADLQDRGLHKIIFEIFLTLSKFIGQSSALMMDPEQSLNLISRCSDLPHSGKWPHSLTDTEPK
jgi:hypothetical protein